METISRCGDNRRHEEEDYKKNNRVDGRRQSKHRLADIRSFPPELVLVNIGLTVGDWQYCAAIRGAKNDRPWVSVKCIGAESEEKAKLVLRNVERDGNELGCAMLATLRVTNKALFSPPTHTPTHTCTHTPTHTHTHPHIHTHTHTHTHTERERQTHTQTHVSVTYRYRSADRKQCGRG
jgi:hypothetical protein